MTKSESQSLALGLILHLTCLGCFGSWITSSQLTLALCLSRQKLKIPKYNQNEHILHMDPCVQLPPPTGSPHLYFCATVHICQCIARSSWWAVARWPTPHIHALSPQSVLILPGHPYSPLFVPCQASHRGCSNLSTCLSSVSPHRLNHLILMLSIPLVSPLPQTSLCFVCSLFMSNFCIAIRFNLFPLPFFPSDTYSVSLSFSSQVFLLCCLTPLSLLRSFPHL